MALHHPLPPLAGTPDAASDPVWLERMYNNRALVPDHAERLRDWAQRSAAVRASQPVALDLRYGPEASETLDVFPAVTAGPAPVLVFLHGGYWRALDKADHSFVAPAFTQAGVCVVVPNYALCPGTEAVPIGIGTIARQMQAALAWVQRHIHAHGGDPARVTVAGHSAGGQLAAWLLAQHPMGAPCLRNALSISGLHDLEPIRHTAFLQQDLRLDAAQVQALSPARLPVPAQGTLVAVAGGDESAEFLRQAQLVQDVWGAQRVPRVEVLPGRNHFTVLEALAEPDHDLHRLALELLRSA